MCARREYSPPAPETPSPSSLAAVPLPTSACSSPLGQEAKLVATAVLAADAALADAAVVVALAVLSRLVVAVVLHIFVLADGAVLGVSGVALFLVVDSPVVYVLAGAALSDDVVVAADTAVAVVLISSALPGQLLSTSKSAASAR